MRIFLTLLRRELAAFFISITGYVIITAVTLLIGSSFAMLIRERPIHNASHGIIF
jgi:hypothetical protein